MRKLLLTLASVFAFSAMFAQPAVVWSYEQKDKGDGTIDLIFKAEIVDLWHIYSTSVLEKGPLPTSFEFNNVVGFEPVGKLRDIGTATKKMDNAFKKEVSVFEKNASFVQTIRKTADGPLKIEGTLSYQICNGKECIIEEADVAFDIKGATTSVSGDKNDSSKAGDNNKKGSANNGLLMFLLLAFAAGLGGVFTPCVFPMIPMTVGFFISGTGSKRAGIIKGLTFGLSVTLIYTLVGVLVALFQSTDATDTLSTHWIPNLIFALLFIVFAISFFGAFEIMLPSGLANKADARADKGGYIASFFVAVAMVIVSFSCTGPFVGSILAAAVTGGLALKPVLGMFVFGLAFSLPFVLFSFFPSLMKKMPKSGGWLNVVKVVFAFILLAFSLKYLASVDMYFGWEIITRPVFISVWIVLAIMLGLYMLGVYKTSHDSDVNHVGTGRLLFAILSFSFAVYLVPGFLGAPLSSLSGIIPPADASTFVIGNSFSTPGPNSGAQITNSTGGSENLPQGLCGPAKYADPQHQAPYGLPAYFDIEQALECSGQVKKPVLLSFKAVTCSVCKLMEANVWSDPRVLDILRNKIVLANLYIDNRTELPASEQVVSTIDGKVKNTLGRKLRDYQLSHFGVASQPYYVLVDQNQKVLVKPVGECSVEEFLAFLKSGIAAFEKQLH